jgi:hypothetical protein
MCQYNNKLKIGVGTVWYKENSENEEIKKGIRN